MDTMTNETLSTLWESGLVCISGDLCCADDCDHDTVIIKSVN